MFFFCKGYGDHRDRHVLTHAFPTLRPSDLITVASAKRSCRERCSGQAATAISICSTPPAKISVATAGACTIGTCRSAVTTSTIMLVMPTRATTGPSATSKRSEEHTSELQSLMRISYAVFCLKKKKNNHHLHQQTRTTRPP